MALAPALHHPLADEAGAMTEPRQSDIDPALQRWAIAWDQAVRLQSRLQDARQTMAAEHSAVQRALAQRGGSTVIQLLDGQRIRIEAYLPSGVTMGIIAERIAETE